MTSSVEVALAGRGGERGGRSASGGQRKLVTLNRSGQGPSRAAHSRSIRVNRVTPSVLPQTIDVAVPVDEVPTSNEGSQFERTG